MAVAKQAYFAVLISLLGLAVCTCAAVELRVDGTVGAVDLLAQVFEIEWRVLPFGADAAADAANGTARLSLSPTPQFESVLHGGFTVAGGVNDGVALRARFERIEENRGNFLLFAPEGSQSIATDEDGDEVPLLNIDLEFAALQHSTVTAGAAAKNYGPGVAAAGSFDSAAVGKGTFTIVMRSPSDVVAEFTTATLTLALRAKGSYLPPTGGFLQTWGMALTMGTLMVMINMYSSALDAQKQKKEAIVRAAGVSSKK